MLIIANFIGDTTFSHVIDTKLLKPDLRVEIENSIKESGMATFENNQYFSDIQRGYVLKRNQFPITIHGIIDVYLE